MCPPPPQNLHPKPNHGKRGGRPRKRTARTLRTRKQPELENSEPLAESNHLEQEPINLGERPAPEIHWSVVQRSCVFPWWASRRGVTLGQQGMDQLWVIVGLCTVNSSR